MKNISVLAVGFVLVSSLLHGEERNVPLIPLPKQIEWLHGTFTFSQNTPIVDSTGVLSKYFIEQVEKYSGISFHSDLTSDVHQRIILRIDTRLDSINKEAYTLSVSESTVEIIGAADAGLMRGMQTFFQLIPSSVKSNKTSAEVQIPCVAIIDKPVFAWRGLNLDCARHFMTKDFLKRYIDILAYYKFNTLHWHLTDDQGWRIEILKYPKLTEVGARRREGDGSMYGGFYTQDDIKEIVAYAQSRNITIVPEIEMPGHSTASLASYPENSCTGGPFEVTNMWGVHKDIYCAGKDSTFIFLQNILDEVTALFPGRYVHIGGDEAPKDRWKECSSCQARIVAEGLKDEHELQSYFIQRISNYLHSKGKEVIGWDEILQGGLAPGVIVQSWQDFQGAIKAAKLGHYTICSPASHTYLDHDADDLDLRIVYSFQPAPDDLTAEEKKYVLGSEVNLWTEHAPQEKVDDKLFPRMLALSEVFWKDPHNNNYDEFYSRVQEAYKDMAALGIRYGRESKVITPTTTYDHSKKEFTVGILQGQKGITIRYTLNGKDPDASAAVYSTPITVKQSASVKVAAFKDDHPIGKQYTLSFDFHKALNAKISLAHSYDERYRAGGEYGLSDGVRGTNNHRDGLWQGYEGVDFEGVIDLGKEKEIGKVTPTFLLNAGSWIFLPVKVEISLSRDNIHFTAGKTVVNDFSQKNSDVILKDFPAKFKKQKARFIRVRATSMKKCPEWHPGAGAPAWMFIDEIVVD